MSYHSNSEVMETGTNEITHCKNDENQSNLKKESNTDSTIFI